MARARTAAGHRDRLDAPRRRAHAVVAVRPATASSSSAGPRSSTWLSSRAAPQPDRRSDMATQVRGLRRDRRARAPRSHEAVGAGRGAGRRSLVVVFAQPRRPARRRGPRLRRGAARARPRGARGGARRRPARPASRSSSSCASSSPAEALIAVADEHDARMIVVGSYGERPLQERARGVDADAAAAPLRAPGPRRPRAGVSRPRGAAPCAPRRGSATLRRSHDVLARPPTSHPPPSGGIARGGREPQTDYERSRRTKPIERTTCHPKALTEY